MDVMKALVESGQGSERWRCMFYYHKAFATNRYKECPTEHYNFFDNVWRVEGGFKLHGSVIQMATWKIRNTRANLVHLVAYRGMTLC